MLTIGGSPGQSTRLIHPASKVTTPDMPPASNQKGYINKCFQPKHRSIILIIIGQIMNQFHLNV